MRFFILAICLLAVSALPVHAENVSIKVGVDQYEPLVFVDIDGDVKGFSVDVLEDMAVKEGWEVEYVPCPWADCLEMLERGELDLLVDIAYTRERDEVYDFTNETIISDWGVIYTRPDSDINSILDMDGKTIAVLREGIFYLNFRSELDEFGINATFIEVDDYDTVFSFIEQGKADAGIVGRLYGSSQEMNYDVERSSVVFSPVELRFAVTGGRNQDLLATVDEYLFTMKEDRDSVYYQSQEIWITGPSEFRFPEWFAPALGILGLMLIFFVLSSAFFKSQVNKRTEELMESEKKYRLIFENSPLGIFHFDKYGIITHCNDKFLGIVGASREDVIGFSMMDSVMDKKMKAAVDAVLSGKPGRYEGDYLSVVSGKVIPLRAEYSPNLAKDGSLLGGIGIFEDITERKLAEKELRASEEKYSTLVERGNDGIIIIQDSELKFANAKYAEMLGYRIEEVVGKSPFKDVSEKYMELVIGRYHKRIQKNLKIPRIYDIEMVSKDGIIIPVEVNASYIEYEGRPADMVILRDITERKLAEKELRASEEKYSTLVEKGNDGIIIIQDYVLKFVNSKFAETMGYSKEEAIGLELSEIVATDHRDLVLERYKKRIKNDQSIPRKYEVYFLSKAGEKIPVEINASYIEYEGKPADMAMIRDITERKRAEKSLKKYAQDISNANQKLRKYSEELSKANDELRLLDKMKNEFLSNISHELKTPLVSIIGYTELIDDEVLGDINDKQKDALETVIRNSERLKRLVDSLLYMSMVQAGTFKYSFEQIVISELIENTISDMKLQVEKKGLSVQMDVPEGLPLIRGDRDKLKDLIINLIDNSIKFTPSGGIITIKAQHEEDNMHIMVMDNGIGISKEVLPKLFQSFYQVDSSTRRKYGGTGLGLSICKTIVDAHKGKIWIESEEGVGTTVHVKLPTS